MNTEQLYGFDVFGFIHLPRVLTPEEVRACNRAIDAVGRDDGMLEWPSPHSEPFQKLLAHPVLNDCLEALCGPGSAIDRSPSMVAPGAEGNAGPRLTNYPPDRNRRLRYVNHPDGRICHGLRVIWALAPTDSEQGGLVLVPASHNRNYDPPAVFLDGQDDMGMTVEQPLRAGDLLICAATTLHGVRGRPGRLIEADFISARAMPTGGFPEVAASEWYDELAPEQQAVVGPRSTGHSSALMTDGQRTWTADSQDVRTSGGRDFGGLDAKDLWFWDVRGYLVVKGVMDEPWLNSANAAIDSMIEMQPTLPPGHPTKFEEVPEAALRDNDWKWPEDTSSRIRGEINRPRLGGLYQLPKPHCEPFRRMIANPAVVHRLNWLLGPGFKEITEPMCCVYPKGTTGGSLHGQSPWVYSMFDGLPLVDQLNVAWSLGEEVAGFGEDSGGFICVPGSHKASFPIPGSLATSIDIPQVYKPPLKAGDVLMFGPVAHGTTAWRSPWDRRNVIQFMSSPNVAIRPADTVVGWRWSKDPTNPKNTLAAKA
jgi:ectoine hydroxylase-related dioxygenase (phytanoyl-CoA dioxygenase family)